MAFALARALRPDVGVFGMDFCEPMLERAETRKARRPAPLLRRRVPPRGRAQHPRRGGELRRRHDRVRAAQHKRPRALPVRDPARAQARGAPLRPRVLAALAHRAPRLPPLPAAASCRRSPGFSPATGSAYEYLGDTIAEFPGRDALSAELADGRILRRRGQVDDDGRRGAPLGPAPAPLQLKDFPHPQVECAFGFRISKPLPWRPSSKSTVVPSR